MLGFVIMGIFVVGSGLLNRMRGGWHPKDWFAWEDNLSPAWLMHDLFPRLLIGLAYGITTALFCDLEPQGGKRLVLFAPMTVFTTFSLYTDWDTYMYLGTNSDVSQLPMGVFDWLVGHPKQGWAYWERWARDLGGMCLTGLIQTAAPGIVLYLWGYGWEFMFSGLAMGFLYWTAAAPIWGNTPSFSHGYEIGELLWGIWTMIVLLLALWSHMKEKKRAPTSGISRILVSICTFIIFAIFAASITWFAIRGQTVGNDTRDWAQQLLGLCIPSAGILAAVCAVIISKCIYYNNTRKYLKSALWKDEQFSLLDEDDDDHQHTQDMINIQYGGWSDSFPPTRAKKLWYWVRPVGIVPWRYGLLVVRIFLSFAAIAFTCILGLAIFVNLSNG